MKPSSTRFIKRQSKKKGLPPGSLVSVSDRNDLPVQLSFIDYNEQGLIENKEATIGECLEAVRDESMVTWIHVQGLSDPKIIDTLGQRFGISGLFLEDVLNTDHRPKLEEYNDTLFVIAKSLMERSSTESSKIQFEQVSIFLGPAYVISFQETRSPLFESVKERLRQSKGKIRSRGPDYLFSALLDTIVDNYFSSLESLGKEIEDLEISLNQDLNAKLPNQILKLRSDILYLSRATFPLKETMSSLRKVDRDDVSAQTKAYFRDTYDHTVYINDVVENYRQLLNSVMETYQGLINQKTNEIVKFLTIFSAFFIPLTFIVGIYGMNFENLPELKWMYGYHFVWGTMGIITVGLFLFFKRKKWL